MDECLIFNSEKCSHKDEKRGKEKSVRDIRLPLRYFRFQLLKLLRICVQLVFVTLKA